MALEEEERVQLTPLVIGLTRPPMMLGVPFNAFILIIGLTVIAFLVLNSFWSVLIAPITYLVLFSACSYDNRILEVLQIASSKTPRTANKAFWGTDTYVQ